MTFREYRLDLTDRVAEIDERLETLETEIAELEQEVRSAMEREGVADPTAVDGWSDLRERDSELQDEKTSLEGERSAFIDAVVQWETNVDVRQDPTEEALMEAYGSVDSCVFRIQELSFGQVQAVQDDMMQASFDLDVQSQNVEGTPREGYMKLELLREAIVDWPIDAPTDESGVGGPTPEPGDYPEPVAEWLYNRVDAFNTTQEEQLENLSLEERMRRN